MSLGKLSSKAPHSSDTGARRNLLPVLQCNSKADVTLLLQSRAPGSCESRAGSSESLNSSNNCLHSSQIKTGEYSKVKRVVNQDRAKENSPLVIACTKTLIFVPSVRHDGKRQGDCNQWVSKGQCSRGQACSFKHGPPTKGAGKDRAASHHHVVESPLIQMANKGERALYVRQTNHIVACSNRTSVTGTRLEFFPEMPLTRKDFVTQGTNARSVLLERKRPLSLPYLPPLLPPPLRKTRRETSSRKREAIFAISSFKERSKIKKR